VGRLKTLGRARDRSGFDAPARNSSFSLSLSISPLKVLSPVIRTFRTKNLYGIGRFLNLMWSHRYFESPCIRCRSLMNCWVLHIRPLEVKVDDSLSFCPNITFRV
jgi:hypothetical protein